MSLMPKGHLKFTKFLLSIIILAVCSIFPFTVSASSSSGISVNTVPENPSPGENTTINLSSYANNLDSVLISWSVDGKSITSGIGKKSFSVIAPATGTEIDVVAAVSLPDGTVSIQTAVRPATMVLLWQADDSYVPPFYRGKAMPTPDSEIKVVAMPEIKTGSKIMDPAALVYAWKKDYNNDQTNSGYGKNFFIYTSDYLDASNTIGVTASTTDQSYSSEKNITISTSQPKITFYKNDAALGTLWEHALSDGYKISGNEVVEAAPYFVSPGDIRVPSLVFDWFINGNMVPVDSFKKNLMPLGVPAGTSGTSKIRLEISNTYKIFENTSKEININF